MKCLLPAIVLCVLLLSACRRNTENKVFWPCTDIILQDSAAIASQLTGNWKWEKQRSGSTGEEKTADKDIRVTFTAGGAYTVLENTTVLAQGNWSLNPTISNLWELDLTASSNYLRGYIAFCNNKVMFSYSYLDGLDNVFQQEQ